jgi:signal transduction histidine kinase
VSRRAVVGGVLLALTIAVLAPDPVAFWADAPVRHLAAPLDPALRVPFASTLLRPPAGAAPRRLAPGDRVLGLRLPGDTGLVAPRRREDLPRLLASLEPGTPVRLEVRGARGDRQIEVPVVASGTRAALTSQGPVLLAGTSLLLFALVCAIGGRHPVAAPLGAVSGCLAVALLAAIDLALPGDTGLLGLGRARARFGVLAWSLLPATLLHLAARFPVVVPRFRRPTMAALPYALWAVPATLAQVRFEEAAVGHAVERLALAASFVAGATLVATSLRPGRSLRPVERARARAATAGFVVAGVGPLAAFVRGAPTGPAEATGLSLGAVALPLALGWSVARYRLLDPPPRLQRALLGITSAVLVAGAWLAVCSSVCTGREAAPAGLLAGLGLTATYALLRKALERVVSIAAPTPGREAWVTGAARALSGAASPAAVLELVDGLLRKGLGAGAVAWVLDDTSRAVDPLARRGGELWRSVGAPGPVAVVQPPRTDDPDPHAPEAVLRIEPRCGDAVLAVVAARPDGLPYAPEEMRALEDLGRLAALALGDARDAARLDAAVTARTVDLQRALDDRSALLEAAERIQAAPDGAAVRAAVAAFLAERTDRQPRLDAGPLPAHDEARVVVTLCRQPVRTERLVVDDLAPDRAIDLQPQARAVSTLANLALERLHLLEGLKLEVARQARELARATAGRHQAEFARRVAHELRKPCEEIVHQMAALRSSALAPAAVLVDRLEAAACDLSRRLDALLARGGLRLDMRRVDLVPLVDEAVRRVVLLRGRRIAVDHARPHLPVVGDPVRLLSLIENLIDNAVRATVEGGRVGIRTAWSPPPAPNSDPWASLVVEDDGPGIPPELGDEVFEPGVGRFRGGFGLGLALVRDVAAAHGGHVGVASQPGRTVFRVRLPQRGAPEAGS